MKKEGKILGAICAAPGILAHAGLLKGKKATMFDDTGVIGQFGGIWEVDFLSAGNRHSTF